MSKFACLGAAAALSIVFASPLPARPLMHELDACPVSSAASGNAGPPAPSAAWLPPGCEKSTLPWSAPVGHRQPQATDVPEATSWSERTLEDENTMVDRLIKGICRGC
jgi:hypothetical protein